VRPPLLIRLCALLHALVAPWTWVMNVGAQGENPARHLGNGEIWIRNARRQGLRPPVRLCAPAAFGSHKIPAPEAERTRPAPVHCTFIATICTVVRQGIVLSR
jgi:hypothetical protein